MSTKLGFFDYSAGIDPSRILPYDRDKVVPVQLVPKLTQINLNSVSELYSFISSENKKQYDAIANISQLSEDDMERLKESITRKLEQFEMIQARCEDQVNPCKTLPPNVIKKDPGGPFSTSSDSCLKK